MEVDNDLEVVFGGPDDGLGEVWELALDIGVIVQELKGPVADWQTNVVQAMVGEFSAEEQNERKMYAYPAALMSLKSCSVTQVSQ